MDDYRRPVGPVETGIPMQRFIGVGNKPYWAQSLMDPARHATWVIVQQSDTDAVWRSLSLGGHAILADHFAEVYRAGEIHVYRKRATQEDVVNRRGQHLYLGSQRWNAVGANSDGLLNLNKIGVRKRIAEAANYGLNTLRIRCFSARFSREALRQRLTYVLDVAHAQGIKVVCTLADGSPSEPETLKYLPQNFYSSSKAKETYRRHVSDILLARSDAGYRLTDHPAILAWDLVDEPHRDRAIPRNSIKQWIQEMSIFLAGLDRLHLVTVGTSGWDNGQAGRSARSSRRPVSIPSAVFLRSASAPHTSLLKGPRSNGRLSG